MSKSILVNVNRCTGCWTCAMACKSAHKLDVDEFRVYVRTIGGEEIDEPGGTWPNLWEKWMPIFSRHCTSCEGDAATGFVPHCVYNCPTRALTFGDADDPQSAYSLRKEDLRDKGFKAYKIPKWEETRSTVEYVEKVM